MKLSVITITYNHEKYVERALRSAVDQQTSFPYEIVVGEDLSSDGTRGIVDRVAREHPDKVRVLPSDEHLGMHRNFWRTRSASRGELVAILDGDDYWTSPHKLQRQVDFLEQHPECSMCFTNARIESEDGTPSRPYCPSGLKEFSDVEDILAENFVPSCAAVYRGRGRGASPPQHPQLMGDWPMNIVHAFHGKLGYIDETMAVYTKHAGGVWTGAAKDARVQTVKSMYSAVDEATQQKYHALIRALILRWQYHFDYHDVCEQLKDLSKVHRQRLEELHERQRRQLEELTATHRANMNQIRDMNQKLSEQNAQLVEENKLLRRQAAENGRPPKAAGEGAGDQ